MISFNLEGKSPLDSAQLESISKAISEIIKIEKVANIGLAFVDSNTIKELNSKYAGNDYPTDVLSFEYGDGEEGNIGDIAICNDIAISQAKENNISLEAELTLLLVHGVLHILGYDHQDEDQIASLDAIQSDIMKKLNYENRDFKWSH
jgi:probable rRNA maturation factor